MAEVHGVTTRQQATSVLTPAVAESGVPFVVGTAPVQAAENPAAAGQPVLCTSWDEAVARLGYSDNWQDYTLCEAMYSHFKLFGCQPLILCNVLDIANMQEEVAAADLPVSKHKISLPLAALSGSLTIKAAGGQEDAAVYAPGVDYETYYSGENLFIELLEEGSCYEAAQLNVAYAKAAPEQVKSSQVVAGIESVEYCLGSFGLAPDLLLAPGYS